MRDTEELFEELDQIDNACDMPSASREDIESLRDRWTEFCAESFHAPDSLDENVEAVLKARATEVGIEILAVLYRDGDSTEALLFSAKLRDLAPAGDLEAEIAAAEKDTPNFLKLCQARRNIYEDGGARAALKAVLKSTTQPGLKKAAQSVLDLPRPIESAPSLFTLNGFGLGMYGSRDRIGSTIVKTHAICFLFVPVMPLSAYRVEDNGDGYYFLSKNKLSRFASTYRMLVGLALVALIVTSSVGAYLNNPNRLAGLAIDDAQALVAKGDTKEAIKRYEELLSKYEYKADSETLQEAAAELVPLLLAEVPAPLTSQTQEQAMVVLRRFGYLPADYRRGKATDAVLAAVMTWAKALDGPSVEARIASLHMLDRGIAAIEGTDAALQAQRDTQQLNLAATMAEERPLDGFDLYMEAGSAGLKPAGELLLSMNLSQLHSIPTQRLRWAKQTSATAGEPEPVNERVAEASARFDSPEHVALLADLQEEALSAAALQADPSQFVQVALADLWLGQGRLPEATSLLESIGRPGDMISDAQLSLARCYMEAGKISKADTVLTAYLALRLGGFQKSSERYNAESDRLAEGYYDQARAGGLPMEIENQLSATTDEAEQGRIFQEWVWERINSDPRLTEAREDYERFSDVIPAVLQHGMVKLQQASENSGAERDAILADAERIFLAIQADAAGLPTYHLNLGTVYNRLGKLAESEAEFAALLERGEPELSLAVARTYRELGMSTKAQDTAESIWEQKQEPYAAQAAELVAVMVSGLDERETWLTRANQDSPYVRTSLLEVRGERALLAGDDAEADKFFANVAARYSAESGEQASSFNNAAIANQRRYEATGEIQHIAAALQGLEKASALAPGNAIVLGNLAYLREYHAALEALDSYIKVELVRPNSQEAVALLDRLAHGDAKPALQQALKKSSSLRRARTLFGQVQVLAPGMVEAWSSEMQWLERLGDVEALKALSARVLAGNFDSAEAELSREGLLTGELDAHALEIFEQRLRRLQDQAKVATAKGHRPSMASIAYTQAMVQSRKAMLTASIEDAEAAVALFRESQELWPLLGAERKLSFALVNLSLYRIVANDAELKLVWNESARTYGELILASPAFAGMRETLLAQLQGHPEFAEAVALAHRSAGLTDWVLGAFAGDAALQLASSPIFEDESEKLQAIIRHHLDPLSKSDALYHKLLQDN